MVRKLLQIMDLIHYLENIIKPFVPIVYIRSTEESACVQIAGNKKIIKGVADRILELKTAEKGTELSAAIRASGSSRIHSGLGPKVTRKATDPFWNGNGHPARGSTGSTKTGNP